MKKFRIKFLTILVVLFLFFVLNHDIAKAAWELNAGYPQLPLAPTITAESRLPDYILYFFAAAIYIAGVLAVLSLAIAGIQLIMSAENPERMSTAKDRAKSSLIGLALLLGAVVILNTINPKITELGITLNIKEPSGVIWQGQRGKAPALLSVEDTKQIVGYDEIAWPKTIIDINGKTYGNCDEKIYGYMIYWYNKTGFTDASGSQILRCGGAPVKIRSGSYTMVPYGWGVYLFPGTGCGPRQGTDDAPPEVITAAKPNFDPGFDVRSVMIINGPSKTDGPFFGAISFNYSNFMGSGINHLSPPREANYKGCASGSEGWFLGLGGKSFMLKGTRSLLIYRKVAYSADFKSSLNAGAGIILYSIKGFNAGAGKYCGDNPQNPGPCIISGEYMSDLNKPISMKLSDLPIAYPANTQLSQNQMDACLNGKSYQNFGGKCLNSIKIDGSFLVLLSYDEDTAGDNGVFNSNKSKIFSNPVYFQAFPRRFYKNLSEGWEDIYQGPLDLKEEEIGHNARYIEIIPLSGTFVAN